MREVRVAKAGRRESRGLPNQNLPHATVRHTKSVLQAGQKETTRRGFKYVR